MADDATAEDHATGCKWVYWDTPPDGYETFTKVFAEALVARGRVVQSFGSNHTLGVGFSQSGAYGSFTADGTMTKNSQWGYDTGHTLNNKRVQNRFRYHRYKRVCPGGALAAYEIRPIKAVSGPFTDGETSPSWCYTATPYRKGFTYWRDSGEQRSYSTGMQVFGVGLYAQSGWGTNQKLSFHFHDDGLMCASNNEGLGHAGQVRADSGR